MIRSLGTSMIRTMTDFMSALGGGFRGLGNDSLSSRQALGYAPIWYGCNKIAGHIGQLPVGVYKRLERGAERDRQHTVARLLRRPNAYQTPIVFKETIALHSIIDGNGRAAIVRRGGRIVELIPLQPECSATGMIMGHKVHVTRPPEDDRLRLFFETTSDRVDENGETIKDPRGLIYLTDDEVFHIPGLSQDGVCGLPLREVARRSLLTAIGAEERVKSSVTDGFSGQVMLNVPEGVFRKESEAQEFLDNFTERHFGNDKAGKPGMLRDGITASLMQSSNKDVEMGEQRKFQRQDAALWLGLESILGDDASVSYKSLEQKNLAYLSNCLNKWLKRWEEEIEFKLLPSRQFNADTHYVRFNTGALLKSDYMTSVRAWSAAIAATIASPNEARESLDMNPYEGGDVYRNPSISPGESGDDLDADDDDDANDGSGSSDPMQRAITSRFAGMIKTESRRVVSLAEKITDKGGNFIESMERFYSNWQPKLADVAEELELDRQLAADHCAESLESLIAVSGTCQPDKLAESVRACVEHWECRAEEFISLDYLRG